MGETMNGGLAELCKARAHQLVRIPDNVSFEQAAALPVAYGTAHRMMTTNGHVSAGEKVLILGASGGVGVCCVQLAKIAGAYVIACAGSEEKGRRLKEVGADEVILYTQEDFMQVVRQRHGRPQRAGGGSSVNGGVDVVVNFTGGDTWVKSLRTLKLGGRILTCGATAASAGNGAPIETHFSSSATSAGGSGSSGGISRSGSVRRTALISIESSGLPGTKPSPLSPPF